ncbi:GPP34 family phosphoprotein [Streptomyces sp. NBC_01013]|uniref:GOLPH3/VPS74 family protein n=1 Tax=Streptomyces sp. NBC_01013 TaxID=2903718 RepID=UPI003868F8C9|nr:GPP34 family phosphoprotein [Streptomyces sp. NBC_01013]
MTTGDDLLLIAIVTGRRRIRIRGPERLRFALRAAELADLGHAGRIAVGARGIEVIDARRVADRRLNNVLHSLAAAGSPPDAADWLRRTPRSLTNEYLSWLEDRKVVRVRRRRDPGGRTRHEILSLAPGRRRAVLDRLDGVVRAGGGEAPGDADLTLAVLVQLADLARAAYPGLRGTGDRRRLAALVAGGHLASAGSRAGQATDEELAAALDAGADSLTRLLQGELGDLYADFTTGGHGLGHSADPGSWSDGGAGGTGHHGGGGHGDSGHGGW